MSSRLLICALHMRDCVPMGLREGAPSSPPVPVLEWALLAARGRPFQTDLNISSVSLFLFNSSPSLFCPHGDLAVGAQTRSFWNANLHLPHSGLYIPRSFTFDSFIHSPTTPTLRHWRYCSTRSLIGKANQSRQYSRSFVVLDCSMFQACCHSDKAFHSDFKP